MQVAVHIRPLIDTEQDNGCQDILSVTPGTSQVILSPRTSTCVVHLFQGATDMQWAR